MWAPTPYPGVLCLSVNEAVVHGIPDRRLLSAGDLLSIDCGAYIDGYHGDAAITVWIGEIDPAGRRLIDATLSSLAAGIGAARPGARLGDISHAIEATARAGGYGLPRGLGGHGVGTAMHEDPHVPNTGRPNRGMFLREGLVLALEPMLIEGGGDGGRWVERDGVRMSTLDLSGGSTRRARQGYSAAASAVGPHALGVGRTVAAGDLTPAGRLWLRTALAARATFSPVERRGLGPGLGPGPGFGRSIGFDRGLSLS